VPVRASASIEEVEGQSMAKQCEFLMFTVRKARLAFYTAGTTQASHR
jgi:hypothetical protein